MGVVLGILVGSAFGGIFWLVFVHSPTDLGITLFLILLLGFAMIGSILGLVIGNKIRANIKVSKHKAGMTILPGAVGKDV